MGSFASNKGVDRAGEMVFHMPGRRCMEVYYDREYKNKSNVIRSPDCNFISGKPKSCSVFTVRCSPIYNLQRAHLDSATDPLLQLDTNIGLRRTPRPRALLTFTP